ncbi:MAG: DUF2812 domain-containing protein [Clostridia bacterium]
MKTTKRLSLTSLHHYEDFEQRLERYAKEGLILKKIGNDLITLEKSEPQNLKYTVTYFKEGDFFNPQQTDNQLTYLEYAKESGWDLVCENGKLQVFSSTLENPIPFETDEQEKLDNIHECMMKSIVKVHAILICLLMIQLSLRIYTISFDPIGFLEDNITISSLIYSSMLILFLSYKVLSYLNWHRKSQKSIDLGEGIVNPRSKIAKAIEYSCCFIFAAVFFSSTFVMLKDFNLEIIAVITACAVGSLALFRFLVHIQKRLNVPARINKIVTTSIYLIVSVICFVSIMYIGFQYGVKSIEPTTTENLVSKDDFPLTCEQLYPGEYDDNYSFELDVTNTILLKKEEYVQEELDEFYVYGSPYQLSYTIYTSWFNCVEDYIFDNIMDEYTCYVDFDILEELDDELFGTQQAYILKFNADSDSSIYILAYEDMVIYLNCDLELDENGAKAVQKSLLELDFVLI